MSRAPIEDLRRTIDCLPLATREAMLRGVREDDIIVGAYQTHGGNCPMLAAHRRGGRTSFLSFARAWDRFADARHPRRATRRELRVLERNLEGSIAAEQGADLRGAVAEHQASVRARKATESAQLGIRWVLEPVGGTDELDLGDHAAGRELEQPAHHLRDV
jgi:hypothetical protein